MEELYFNLVKAGKRTCNPSNTSVKQVPTEFFKVVLKMLKDDGRDADGIYIETE